MPNKLSDRLAPILIELAAQQNGFFTEKQAETVGFSLNRSARLKSLADSHRWFLIRDGLYRLAEFPPDKNERITEVYFSCIDRRGWPAGVLSHVTALRMYHLLSGQPSAVHITLPTNKTKLAPRANDVIIHKDTIPLVEIEVVLGMYTTSPMRTIVDLVNKSGNRLEAISVIERALQKAISKQLIPMDALDDVPQRMRRLLHGLAKNSAHRSEIPMEDKDFDAADFTWLIDGIV